MQIESNNFKSFNDVCGEFRKEFMGYAVKRSGGNVENAEDAMQEALLRAYARRNEYSPRYGRRGLFAWLMEILRRVCLESYRSRSRREVPSSDAFDFEQIADLHEAGYEEVEDRITDENEHQQAQRMIAEADLSNKQWVIAMAQLQGVSNEQIAERLGMSTNTVRAHISNALPKIRKASLKKKLKETIASPTSILQKKAPELTALDIYDTYFLGIK